VKENNLFNNINLYIYIIISDYLLNLE